MYFPFFLFWWVCMCIFLLWFCQFKFAFTICPMVRSVVCVVCLFFLFLWVCVCMIFVSLFLFSFAFNIWVWVSIDSLFYFILFFLFFQAKWLAVSSWSSQLRDLSLQGGRAEYRTLDHERPPSPMKYQSARAPSDISDSTRRPSSTQQPASSSAGIPMPNN